MANNKLYVKGLSKDTTEAELWIYFQSRKKSGGGDIDSIDYRGESAVITFEEEEVLESVFSRGTHTVKGSQLKVSRQPFISQEPTPEKVNQKDARNDLGCNKIEVSGWSSKTTKDSIENYFENTKRSGGGDVEEFIISDTIAYITFASSEVAQKVLSRDHVLDDVKLSVALHKPEKETKDEKGGYSSHEESVSRVVEISGLSVQTTKDAVCNYFENTRRSGGGDIENVELQEESGVAVVTFVRSEGNLSKG